MSVRKLTTAASIRGSGAPSVFVPFFFGALLPAGPFADVLAIGLALLSVGLFGYCLKLSRSLKKASLERPDLFSDAPFPVFKLDCGLKITLMNRAVSELTGYPVDELTGKDFLTLAAWEDRKSLDDGLKAALEDKKTRRLSSELVFKDNSPNAFELTLVPSRDGVTVMARDIGEVKRLYDEIERVKKEAEDASLKLKKTIKDLEEFALIAVRRERKMQEIRNYFIKPKDPHDRSA